MDKKKSKIKKHLLICTMGLPRSGKSTWSKKMAQKYGIPIVCPDSIRISLYARDFIVEAEPMVWTLLIPLMVLLEQHLPDGTVTQIQIDYI